MKPAERNSGAEDFGYVVGLGVGIVLCAVAVAGFFLALGYLVEGLARIIEAVL